MTREEIFKKINDEENNILQSQQNIEAYRKELEMYSNGIGDYRGKYIKYFNSPIYYYYMYVNGQRLDGNTLVFTGFLFYENLYRNSDLNKIIFQNEGTLYVEMEENGEHNVKEITKEEFDKAFENFLIDVRANKEYYVK